MNTDSGSREKTFLYKEETFAIIGCAMEVLNALGCGFDEKVYENALTYEFARRKILFSQQERFPVSYKGRQVGVFIPDLIAFGKIIVELKTIEKIGNAERGQVLNYLKATGLKLALILNFGKKSLEWDRLAL